MGINDVTIAVFAVVLVAVVVGPVWWLTQQAGVGTGTGTGEEPGERWVDRKDRKDRTGRVK